MDHYICTGGCGAVKETPGTCQTAECSKYNQSLEACDCGRPDNHKQTPGGETPVSQ